MARRAVPLLAAVLWLAGVLELSLRDAEMAGLKYALITNAALAVAVSRRHPVIAVAAVTAGFVILALAGQDVETTAEVLAMAIVLFTAGDLLPASRARATLAAFLCALVVQNAVVAAESPVWDTLWLICVLAIPPWALGRLIRDRRGRIAALERLHAELTAEQERAAALAAEAERARIAREMHDVLSHSVGVMSLQAGAGQRLALAGDLNGATAAARAIAAAGRTALGELDDLFGTAPDELPRDLTDLIAGVRGAGLEVDLRRSARGAPPPPDVELAIHRIVQEALTNAVKHADARQVSVEVVTDRGRAEVRVQDDGSGAGRGGGNGRGLIGMSERARAYGGDLEAGPVEDGGFRVRARLSWA